MARPKTYHRPVFIQKTKGVGGGGSGALENHDFSLIKGLDILPLLGGVNLIASSMNGLYLVHIQVLTR